jgi:hypothetical protein
MPTARRAGQDLIAARASALPPVPAGPYSVPDHWHARRVTAGMPGI